jgi:hypothetical protein
VLSPVSFGGIGSRTSKTAKTRTAPEPGQVPIPLCHTPSAFVRIATTFGGMSNPHAVSRARSSEMIGRKPGTLRAWSAQSPPRGPRPTKTGTAKQARTLYPVDEITAWLADPVAYEAQWRPPNAPRG